MRKWFKNHRRLMSMIVLTMIMTITLTCSVSATGEADGTMSSAISEIQSALTGVIGYLSSVTSALLGNDLWLLGMGFFVLLFVAGFVSYLSESDADKKNTPHDNAGYFTMEILWNILLLFKYSLILFSTTKACEVILFISLLLLAFMLWQKSQQ